MKEGVAVPLKCRRARLTAHHWRPRAKAIVEKMTAKGILVRMDDVAPAVSTGFFVKKPHGNGIRLVADYTGVNKALERPLHHFPAPQEVWLRVTAGSKYFIACDLSAGYWQCELDYKSSLLMTCQKKKTLNSYYSMLVGSLQVKCILQILNYPCPATDTLPSPACIIISCS